MELKELQTLFNEVSRRTNHKEFVVVGSLSILGVVSRHHIPDRMLMSIDVDCFTLQDPDRIFEVRAELGEGSAFEAAHGYYLDPISPKLPTLPDGWKARLVRVAMERGIVAYFLDPNDAAVSKYARNEPRDREWIQAGLRAGLLSAPIIEGRFRQTDFLDAQERTGAEAALAIDTASLAGNGGASS